ncbi:hypothetical protein ACH5RR_016143 [Cinchona calisaya]|uniref:Uncharacterized protein n=1 Tax=Cinchona calisaya TaxID=153742 RepID=A0ABD2ZW23_9GENT
MFVNENVYPDMIKEFYANLRLKGKEKWPTKSYGFCHNDLCDRYFKKGYEKANDFDIDSLANQIETRLHTIEGKIDVVDAKVNLLEHGMRLVMNETQRASYGAYERAKGKQPMIDPMENDTDEQS